MISYRFNKKIGILEAEFKGYVAIDDLTNYIISVRQDSTLPKKLKIISDASKGKFAYKIKKGDLKRFLEENQFTLESKQKEAIFDAFIVSSPMEMALGMIYKELIKIDNYKFNVFSSREAALQWLEKF